MMAPTMVTYQRCVGRLEGEVADAYGLRPFDSYWNGGTPGCFEARYEVQS